MTSMLEQAEWQELLILLLVLAVLLVVVALPIVLAIVRYRKQRARREQIEGCARRLGFRFDAKGVSFNLGEWAELTLFSPDQVEKAFGRFLAISRRVARNVMRGPRNDLDIAVLDYQVSQVSRHSTLEECTAVCVRSAGLDLPAFSLGEPEAGEEEGRIPFTDYPRFSQLYSVYSEDQPRVRSAFTSAIIDFFSAHEGLVVEASGERLAVYRQRRGLVKPDAVPALVEQGVTIAELFKTGRLRAGMRQ